MGRLFWKFFFSILLAQVAATVAIGGAIWLKDRNAMQQKRPDIDTGPSAEVAIESAAATLEYGGVKALRSLLENMDRHRVLAVDEQGRELLGRIVAPVMQVEARYMLLYGGRQRAVREIAAPDGHRYMLFLPSRERLGGLYQGDTRPLMAGVRMFGLAPRHPAFDGERATGDAPGGTAASAGAGASAATLPGANRPSMRPPRGRPLPAFVPIGAAILASLLFAALLAWYFSRPIRDLRQAFEAASHGDLAPRFAHVSSRRGDELSDLGRDFDRMTARLRNLMDAQTRLLHDVSHELRSPLARLQAAIGLAHQQPEKSAASLERIERESVRMDKLVGELLTLARLESGSFSAAREEVGMAELLDDILSDAAFEAATHDRAIEVAGQAETSVAGQADLLARAIENVVRNAIKHSPVGGMVRVELEDGAATRQLKIRVLDRGPGVAPADLQTIFQPFFRSSETPKDVEGHGLGLAIAQHVVKAHGGSIAAANRSDGGLCVEITLPAMATGATPA